MKTNIKFKNTKEHKVFAANLDKYIRSNIHTIDDERETLMFYLIFYKTNKDGELKPCANVENHK